VVADQRYVGEDTVTIPSNVGLVIFEFHGESLRTQPGAMIYRYRLISKHDWKNTKAPRAEYLELSPGDYTFEVQAVDQHLVYSEPATISLTVQPDPEIVAMKAEINHLRSEVSRKYDFDNIIGESEEMEWVRNLMDRAIDSGLNVLITGETGTGKELVAKAIHYNSPRKNYPLLDRNCGAIPKDLLASDLFGYCKGAFTGANEDKAGLFEAASGGTLLLDEIGEMPYDAQTHLLRVLQESKVQRVGENTSRDIDVRIIAITNRDLVKEIKLGHFREDLYYRLDEFHIYVPSLRERREDIPLLAEHFYQEVYQEQEKELNGFSPEVMDMLISYPWPGNVRELRNEVNRAYALAETGSPIKIYHFSPHVTQNESLAQEIISQQSGLSKAVELVKRRMIQDALEKTGGNRTKAAEILKMHRPSLVRLMRDLGIK
jgi:transcriptional regulator with PAS, ATPase and Fis domain